MIRKLLLFLMFALCFFQPVQAAFQIKSGTFNCPAATGSQSVTGVGFQPKALIFFATMLTADGTQVDYNTMVGMSALSTQECLLGGSSDDAAVTQNSDRISSNADSIGCRGPADTILYRADFTSMDADGFTINWANVTNGVDIHYLALGGADLTNVFVGTFNKITTTGNQSVTAPGFQPDCIIFLGQRLTVDVGSGTLLSYCVGAATSSTARWVSTFGAENGAATSDANSNQRTNQVLAIQNAATLTSIADFVSMDANGFTINWSTATAVAERMHYLCLKGGQYKVGSFNQATATGNQAVTGTGFQPVGTLFTSFNAATSGANVTSARHSFGVGISSTDRRAIWSGALDASLLMECDQDSDQTKCLKLMTEGTPTVNAAMDYVSNDSDGFTVNNTTADATAREILYLSFGNAKAGGGLLMRGIGQ